MAQFGWAYINCSSSGGGGGGGQAAGPVGSIQFLTGTNATSGSENLAFYTASVGSYSPNTHAVEWHPCCTRHYHSKLFRS